MPASPPRVLAAGLALLLLPLAAPPAAATARVTAGTTPPATPPATPAATPAATAPVPAPATADPSGPAQAAAAPSAPDEASARLSARLTGTRVEVAAARTETTTTYANPDGTLTVDAFAGPIRYRENGAWKPVDITLTTAPDGQVVPRGHHGRLRLGGASRSRAAGGHTDLITVGEGAQRVTLQWKGALPAPRLEREKATYPGVLPGADLIVEATRTGAEQFLLVRQRPSAPLEYTLRLRSAGLKPRAAAGGGIELADAAGKVAMTLPAPVMWDATVAPGSGEHTRRAPVAVRLRGDELVFTPDPAFLNDPATRYPVTVDPPLTVRGTFDTFVQQGYGTDQSAADELKIGNNGAGQVARSFITWNTAGLAGKKIISATLNLWNRHSWSCLARSWQVGAANQATTASRWPGPDIATIHATSTETKGNGDAGCDDGWVKANVTSLAQHWADKGWTRSGMGIRAKDETDKYGWKRFNSGDAAANLPHISVTYNSYPTTPVSTWVSPHTDHAGKKWTNTTTPQLRNHVGDPDGGTVRGLFDVYDGGTLVIDNLYGAYVAGGGFSSTGNVPAGKLVNGRTYTVRSWSNDGSLTSKAYQTWSFTVDTVKPAAPKIASADYPADGGWHGDAGRAGTFTLTPASGDAAWIAYQLDGGATTKLATTGAAVSVTVTPATTGAHTLRAYTIDKAGNTSPTTSHVFNVGSGTSVAALTAPSDGLRATGRVPLAVTGTGFTQARFQFRRSDADAWADLPVAYVTGADGAPLTAWPVAAASGRASGLTWDAAAHLGDAAVQVRAVVSGTSAPPAESDPVRVVVDRRATRAATREVGPGVLNLLTGDYRLQTTAGRPFGLTLTRTASSRHPGWSLPLPTLKETSPTSVELTRSDGSPVQFTKTADGWKPEPGAEHLTLTGAYTLTDSRGEVTAFTRQGDLYVPEGHAYDQGRPASITTSGRTLDLGYDGAGRLTTVSLKGTVITEYAYDGAGRLTEAWDPRLGPALKTVYGYDSAGRVTTLTPPGELPWTFAYESDGRLRTVTRATLKPGTADQVAGEAKTTVAYGVPLTKAAGGPADMTATRVASWGQTSTPATATSVQPPGLAPTVTYLDASGRAVNVLTPGGHLSATDYDRSGHAVRTLTAANRELSQRDTTDFRLAELAITGYDAAERAELLSTRSVFDASGRRKLEELSPVHIVNLESDVDDLPAGYAIGARSRTVYTYDEGRPAGAAARDLPTTATTGAVIVGRESLPDADVRTTAIAYDWATGQQVTTVRDPGGTAVTTKAAAPVRYTATGGAPCGGRPDWAGLVCQDGGRTYTYDATGLAATVTEGGTVTTLTRDAAGRLTATKAGGEAEIGLGYDAATGRLTQRRRGEEKVVTAYDRLGRVIAHTDADGGLTRTEYDDLDRPVKVTDSAPSTRTYAYDARVEPRGLPTSVTDSVAGTFTARYDAEGRQTEGGLPGGLRLQTGYDERGQAYARVYTRDGLEGPVMIDQIGRSVHGQEVLRLRTDTMAERQLAYDRAGQLVSALEIAFPVCTLRRYDHDGTGNRTRLAVQSSQEDCPAADDSAATITTYAHAADGRLTGDGYDHDAAGRVTALPGGRTFAYSADGLPSRQAVGGRTLTWKRDPAGRVREETTETGAATIHHYGSDGDRPSWTAANGAIVRTVAGIGGELAALTGATGPARLQLLTLDGHVGTDLNLGDGLATVVGYDEFGVASHARRYGWLGGAFRPTTPDGTVLAGDRLYDPALGRFLQPPY
ncbi:DNRLRE domain-containing protein [Bailinhaonella thermotolerans]|uniref:DNRLRE domain-containing protein n=1 Tax=Bailinhaonella thermotolerans TaxID=1070861 RepID=A0A3A4ACY9_9ACTN|nr:DNRLRE domain-containing protein [Bailinhaonella thermotolerans]RJL23920.1 DNRLRE domain-containing protein [Bailinhaonella thermotolerans]